MFILTCKMLFSSDAAGYRDDVDTEIDFMITNA